MATTAVFKRGGEAVNAVTGDRVGDGVPATVAWPVPDLTSIRVVGGAEGFLVGAVDASNRLWGTPLAPDQAMLYVSADSGATWSLVTSFGARTGARILRVVVLGDSTGGEYLVVQGYGAVSGGSPFMKGSRNYGASWTDIYPKTSNFAADLSFVGISLENAEGRSKANSRIYFTPYGLRASQTNPKGAPRIWRSNQTLGQLLAGAPLTWNLVWKFDCYGWAAAYGAQHNVRSSGAVSAAGSLTLIDVTKNWVTNEFGGNVGKSNSCVLVTSGAAAGQYRLIVSNTATLLTLNDAWQVKPAVGDAYQIVSLNNSAQGQHLHFFLNFPADANGAKDVAYFALGDAGSVIGRINGLATLVGIPDAQEVPCQPLNYDQARQVVWQSPGMNTMQPISLIWSTNHNIYMMGSDAGALYGSVYASADTGWDPKLVDRDAFQGSPRATRAYHQGVWGSAYLSGYGTLMASTADGYLSSPNAESSYYLMDPAFIKHWRVSRSTNQDLMYYSASVNEHGKFVGYGVKVTSRPITSDCVTLMAPTWTSTTFYQIDSGCQNLCANADFSVVSGSNKVDGWVFSGVGGALSCSAGGFGGGNYVTLTGGSGKSCYLVSSNYGVAHPGALYHVSVAARPHAQAVNASPPFSADMYWYDAARNSIASSSAANIYSIYDGTWQPINGVFIAPAGAAYWKLLLRNRNTTLVPTSVDYALPCVFEDASRLHLPTPRTHSPDTLTFTIASGSWTGASASRVKFAQVGWFPTDINQGTTFTIATLLAASGHRLLLTWEALAGVRATLQDQTGAVVTCTCLGNWPSPLTQLDLCEWTVDWDGRLRVSVQAGADTLSAQVLPPSFSGFFPEVIQLGGDQWNSSNRGLTGFYAMTGVYRGTGSSLVLTADLANQTLMFSWPPDGGLWQLQKTVSLLNPHWEDVGEPTTNTTVLEPVDGGVGFYRLLSR